MKKGKQMLMYMGVLAALMVGMRQTRSFFGDIFKFSTPKQPKIFDQYCQMALDAAASKRARRKARNLRIVAAGGAKAVGSCTTA